MKLQGGRGKVGKVGKVENEVFKKPVVGGKVGRARQVGNSAQHGWKSEVTMEKWKTRKVGTVGKVVMEVVVSPYDREQSQTVCANQR